MVRIVSGFCSKVGPKSDFFFIEGRIQIRNQPGSKTLLFLPSFLSLAVRFAGDRTNLGFDRSSPVQQLPTLSGPKMIEYKQFYLYYTGFIQYGTTRFENDANRPS